MRYLLGLLTMFCFTAGISLLVVSPSPGAQVPGQEAQRVMGSCWLRISFTPVSICNGGTCISGCCGCGTRYTFQEGDVGAWKTNPPVPCADDANCSDWKTLDNSQQCI
jgi:hypothetical protein